MKRILLEKIILIGAVFLLIGGGLFVYQMFYKKPAPARPNTTPYTESTLTPMEQIPESTNTPEEINNKALLELDTLIQDISSDTTLNDSLLDLESEE